VCHKTRSIGFEQDIPQGGPGPKGKTRIIGFASGAGNWRVGICRWA
jgi:hypothetical protein